MTKVRDIMTPNPKTCRADHPLTEVLQLMEAQDVGVVPIVDDQNRLQAILTDRDIVLSLLDKIDRPIREWAVLDCLANDRDSLVTASPDDELIEVLQRMEDRQIRRIPVCDEQGHCIGIVSQADIVRNTDNPRRTHELLQEISGDKVPAGING